MFVTLWHEVLHAIDDLVGAGLGEEEVDRLASGIAQVLLQNPGLQGGGFTRGG